MILFLLVPIRRHLLQGPCARPKQKENPDLGSGFILRSGMEEYDWNQNGRKKFLEEKLKEIDIIGAESLMAKKDTEQTPERSRKYQIKLNPP